MKFSDGTPFTAEDVVFTYDRVPKVPNSPSPFTLYLGSVAKTEAVDPMTLRITTKDVAPNLLVNLAQLPIMSKKAASGPAAEGKTTTELNSGDGLVGTGPYKFVSWKRGAEFVLARNDSYWGKKPEWDKVIYRPISNPAARVAALLAGDVDMIEDPQPTTCPSSRATRSSTSRKPLGARGVRGAGPACRASPGVQGTDKNPMKDKRVREALSLAINRDALVERVMGGVALPAGNLLPYPMFGSSKEHAKAPKADVERPRRCSRKPVIPTASRSRWARPRAAT